MKEMKHFSEIIFENNKNKSSEIAIVDRNGKRKTTWDELYKHACKVASYAVRNNISGVVPICMERAEEAVATILGLNMAGVGVAPQADSIPAKRLAYISRQCENTPWTQKDYKEAMREKFVPFEHVEKFGKPAYVVYTSGSTGNPKGVMIDDYAVIESIYRSAGPEIFDVRQGDIFMQQCSMSFVAIVLNIFTPLYCGCTVHFIPDDAIADAELMSDYIEEHKITSAFISPKILKQLRRNNSFRVITTGSERVSQLGPDGYTLKCVYGMSEVVALCTSYTIEKSMNETPIGVPTGTFKCYVLDDDGNEADEGELCISGPVAYGYMNEPELTKKTFTSNPFSNEKEHKILLHTGDMVKKLSDGNLVFINRKDFMIKINGQRVEPGEVEIKLQAINGIDDAVVKGFENEDGKTFLCAYYVSDSNVTEKSLRKSLSGELPHYMVPSFFIKMDKLPLNSNNKIDRKALKAPDVSLLQSSFADAENDIEKELCRVFEKILRIEKVGINDDFFRLGGDSISAIQLVSECNIPNLKVADVVSGKTPKHIASKIKKTEAPSVVTVRDSAPLTDSQRGIYLQCSVNPESKMYNIPVCITYNRVEGITLETVKSAVDLVLSKHPALLSHISMDGEVVSMVRGKMPRNGLCTVKQTDIETVKQFKSDFVRPIDMFKGPLVRANAFLTSDKIYIFLDIHHIAADGTSVSIIAGQLDSALFGETVADESADPFSLYDLECRDKNECNDNDYYAELLSDANDANLIRDITEEKSGIRHSIRKYFHISGLNIASRLMGTGITESSFFMSVFGYVISKMTMQKNAQFTAGENGRKYKEQGEMVSMMVKSLPVVVNLDEEMSGLSFALDIQNQFHNTIAHDTVALGDLIRDYGINTDVMFVYQGAMLSGLQGKLGKADIEICETGDAFTNLAVYLNKYDDEYVVWVEYRDDLYTDSTIERFGKLFEKVSREFLDVDALKNIRLISDADEKVLDEFNNTDSPYDNTKTVVDLFRANVEKNPNKLALVFKDKNYTYSQLDEISDRIATFIHNQGLGKNDTVSIMISRSEYMGIAPLGVMKAGARYQPLDPTYPPERLDFLHKDADAKLLIVERELYPILKEYKGRVLFTDEIEKLPKETMNFAAPSLEDSYVLLYTSGTTGTPKGNILTHSNLAAFIHAYSEITGVDCNTKHTAYASFGFDGHMLDFYPTFAAGGTAYIIPEEMRLNFPELRNYIVENEITHAFMTTQVARQFATDYGDITCLKSMCTGGEKLLPFPKPTGFTFYNMYGPSETTIGTSTFTIDKTYDDIPIGVPYPNMKMYVVDAYGRRLPIGVPGELIISGPQVGKGYLNREEQTKKVFVLNSFEKNPDSEHINCYCSGDVVRYLDDGNLQYIGRRDLQVKIRGYRIELSEVEKVIREYPGITDAVVVARDDLSGKCLNAYIVSAQKVDISKLNSYIKQRKPAYMVPSATMQIEAIPLTPNQKVDKRRLPEIVTNEISSDETASRSMTKLEEGLSKILSSVVGNDKFSVETEFVDVGISSMTAVKLSVAIYKKYGVNVSTKDILDGGTILSVENLIVSSLLAGTSSEKEKTGELLKTYSLTQTQMGIYLDCMRVGSDAYNIPFVLKLPESINIGKLKNAVIKAVKLHPSMLCYIHTDENGDVCMYPRPDMDIAVEEETQNSIPFDNTHFEFGECPLFRFRIIEYSGNKYLSMEIHHIIADGESMTILLSDISKIYLGKSVAEEKYTAYNMSLDEQKERNGDNLAKAKDYYDSVFRGLSADYLPCSDRQGNNIYAQYSSRLFERPERIKNICAKYGITENILFMAAFGITIARYTAHEDAVFSTIYNGRNDPRTENLVSMLVKTLPVYVNADGAIKTADYLKKIDEHLRLLKKHDIYSFADVARDYGVNADVMFIYQGRMMSDTSIGGEPAEKIDTVQTESKSELSIQIYEDDRGYKLLAEFNGGRYSNAWIESFAEAYTTCVSSLINSEQLSEVDILSQKELRKFDSFNDTDDDIPYRPAYRHIQDAAQKYPDRTAVIACGEKLTFRQLNCMANYVGSMLLNNGISQGSIVEVICRRTKEIYVARQGILKGGSAFLFMAPDYPDERIAYATTDAGVNALMTTHDVYNERKEFIDSLNLPIFFADDVPVDTETENLNLEVGPNELAYLIYTSGTTGTPKGVKLIQKGFNNLLTAGKKNCLAHNFIRGNSVAVSVSTFSFDASVIEENLPLSNGVTTVIANEDEVHDPIAFTKLCLDNNVTSTGATPSFLLNMLEYPKFKEVIKNMTNLISAGEAMPQSLAAELMSINPKLIIINGYGPTETTVGCSASVVVSPDHITIGKPISNTKIYMVDKYNHILPKGALGELTILGDGVGLGYVNRDDLTKKVFFKLQGKPAYRSGDLATVTQDDEIEFHGRIDNQVKLRGLRVELGEIESAISSCEDVRSSVVIVLGDEKNKYLVAYYTASRKIEPEEITQKISKTLTEYMVPRILMQLDAMPLTANGKIDKKALPEPTMNSECREYVAPSTEIEKELCDAFAKALGVEEVGITDDFFSLGGTSLTATKVAMFATSHSIPVVYADIFKYPTVKELARIATKGSDRNSDNVFDVDYTDINNVLERNVITSDGVIEKKTLGDVVITGSTGFLGMHMLNYFLNNEEGKVYCLLRKGDFSSPEMKLIGMYIYYFDESIEDLMGNRIFCIDGDITDKESVEALKDIQFDTLLNCAACVKHFANNDILERVNVTGVEYLADMCLETKRKLIHVSTISVAGESVNNVPCSDHKLVESELFFSQTLDNQYIISKFKSEKIVLERVAKGLDAKIMRAGNLMPRSSDGEFQINYLTNGFMRRLHGYYALGCIPFSALSSELEFSPIDETAGTMIQLAKTDSRFSVFHTCNTHRVFMSDVARAMNEVGLHVESVSDSEFAKRLNKALTDTATNQAVSGLIAYMNRENEDHRVMLGYKNEFTRDALNRIGYGWNVTDHAYLKNAFVQLKEMGFFDLEL